MAKLKIAGTWSGVLEEVDFDNWTISSLREEVAKRSNCDNPHFINLICAGRILKDDNQTLTLTQLGIKNNSKILATVTSPQQGQSLVVEEQSSHRLARIR